MNERTRRFVVAFTRGALSVLAGLALLSLFTACGPQARGTEEDFQDPCSYEGRTYSDRGIVCMGGRSYVCDSGIWRKNPEWQDCGSALAPAECVYASSRYGENSILCMEKKLFKCTKPGAWIELKEACS